MAAIVGVVWAAGDWLRGSVYWESLKLPAAIEAAAPFAAVGALLFVGGVMNLAWIAALSIAVAIEKLLPHGERLATLLGLVLIAAGVVRLVGLAGGV